MAIDDNTSYELTGAQVKDLANKIKGKADDNAFVGATSAVAGVKGIVPEPQAGDDAKFLSGDGTWKTVSSGATITSFYLNADPGSATHVYKDSAMQTLAAASDINDALDDGPVRLVYDDDEYDIIANSKYGGMSNNGSWSVYDGTNYYYMSFVNATTLYWDAFALQQRLTAGTNITIAADGVTISATDTTYTHFTGATSSADGTQGLVPGPLAGDQEKVLHGDGTWKDTTAKLVEMSYGESNAWAKFIAAYNAGSIVYCRASSNSNPGTGSQTRKAFMAYVNNATSPTNVEFQYVRSMSSKTDSQQCDQVFVYTLTNASGGTWSVATRNMAPKINVNAPITKTFTTGANATLTLGANAMTGATSSAAGTAGVVPAPSAGDQNKFLRGDGTWVSNYVVHYDTFTATTDSNGFASVPTATVTPSTGMVLAASSSSQQGFTTPFNDVDQSRFAIKTESWNRTAVGNTSVTYNIAYILY